MSASKSSNSPLTIVLMPIGEEYSLSTKSLQVMLYDVGPLSAILENVLHTPNGMFTTTAP